MLLYRILLGIVGLTAAVIAFFFLWGLGDETISADNVAMWLVLLAVPAAVLFGAHQLTAKGQRAAALALLAVLAIPATLIGLFFLILIIAAPDWR